MQYDGFGSGYNHSAFLIVTAQVMQCVGRDLFRHPQAEHIAAWLDRMFDAHGSQYKGALFTIC
jgi:hypothetical protein